jgi:electron transfer flavoprotein beta subunit
MSVILVCQKWVAPDEDPRAASHSPADKAALEVALMLRDQATSSVEVIVVSLGGPGARHGLRDSLARGADRALWISAPTDLRSDAVAAAIHRAVSTHLVEIATPDWVICGDYSSDRGSGSVPAFLADLWNAEQALGLVQISEHTASQGGSALGVTRRLDGGRRERLVVTAPGVLSVEGSVASLRRASLNRELAAGDMPILEAHGPTGPREAPTEITRYRPRARMLTAPAGKTALERVRSITEPATAVAHGETVVLPPAEAADRILATLAEWGYLSPEDSDRHNAR